MNIPYLSRALAFPFVLLLILYFTTDLYNRTEADYFLLIPSIFSLVILYIFNEPIDKWWWKRRPPPLDPWLKKWLKAFSPYYRSLEALARERFERRLSVFVKVKNFTHKEKQDYHVQEDVKTLIAHDFIRITLNRKDYLFAQYERIVVYSHPFASPEHQFLHTLEFHDEDGVIIISREQLANGFNRAIGHFNLGLYAAVSAFITINPRENYPSVKEYDLEQISALFELNLSSILATLGFNRINKLNLLLYCFFSYPDKFARLMPERYESLIRIFGVTIRRQLTP